MANPCFKFRPHCAQFYWPFNYIGYNTSNLVIKIKLTKSNQIPTLGRKYMVSTFLIKAANKNSYISKLHFEKI